MHYCIAYLPAYPSAEPGYLAVTMPRNYVGLDVEHRHLTLRHFRRKSKFKRSFLLENTIHFFFNPFKIPISQQPITNSNTKGTLRVLRRQAIYPANKITPLTTSFQLSTSINKTGNQDVRTRILLRSQHGIQQRRSSKR